MREKDLRRPVNFLLEQWAKQVMNPLAEVRTKGERAGFLRKVQAQFENVEFVMAEKKFQK